MACEAEKLLFKIIVILILSRVEPLNFTNKRSERSLPLLYTNTSAITFITGFGIPVNNLNPELVTVGMVFKAQQFLPTTFQALWNQSSHRIERQSVNKYEHSLKDSMQQDHILSKYRIFFYRALEQLSMSLGQKGHACVLKMICEASTSPFHYRNGILGELLYILLTPSSSLDSSQDYDYGNAEKLGKNGSSCGKLFQDCSESILERVTNVFE